MKIHTKYYIFLVVIVQASYGQKKNDDIGTETVNVVKPYTPTISDATKIKEVPSQKIVAPINKETVKYSIFSVPVASTFIPSKGVAAKVEKMGQEQLFRNYVSAAAGNYGNIDALLNITQPIDNKQFVTATFKHLSSQGGIKNVFLNNAFYDSSLDATYDYKTKPLSWNINMGIQNQLLNWYGLDPAISNSLVLMQIDPKQSFNTFILNGHIRFSESVLKETSISSNYFTDGYRSTESRVVIQPKLELEILNEKVYLNFSFDYLNGSFKNDFLNFNSVNYGFTNVGFQPTFNIAKDDLSINLGVSIFYSAATEEGKNKFYLYPNVTASYKLVGDIIVGFAGAEGGLVQNSYRNFVHENNFVIPNILVVPTDKKFDIYAGLRGKLSNFIGYNVKASLVNEDYKPLFKNTNYDSSVPSLAGFAFGNSFEVRYDTVKTIAISGELNGDFDKNVTFKLEGIFSKYVLSNETEPWNLPTLQINSSLGVKIAEKWNAGFKLFFVGERKDQFSQIISATVVKTEDKTIAGFLDLNAHLNYNYSKQLGFFIKGNNLVNQNYQRWLNYSVQGIQVLLGANYKFDF